MCAFETPNVTAVIGRNFSSVLSEYDFSLERHGQVVLRAREADLERARLWLHEQQLELSRQAMAVRRAVGILRPTTPTPVRSCADTYGVCDGAAPALV